MFWFLLISDRYKKIYKFWNHFNLIHILHTCRLVRGDALMNSIESTSRCCLLSRNKFFPFSPLLLPLNSGLCLKEERSTWFGLVESLSPWILVSVRLQNLNLNFFLVLTIFIFSYLLNFSFFEHWPFSNKLFSKHTSYNNR